MPKIMVIFIKIITNAMKRINSIIFLALALLACTTFSSCEKESPAPATKTVLASIVGSDVLVYENTVETYVYDEDFRIVKAACNNPFLDKRVFEYDITYRDGSILIEGINNGEHDTITCTLDAEGRIVTIEKTTVGELNTSVSLSTYTYDDKGRLASCHKDFGTGSGGTDVVYTWEGDEIKETNTSNGALVISYEISSVPAEAYFDEYGYDSVTSFLCPQGCFGRLPAHMPAKKSIKTTLAGISMTVGTVEYKTGVGDNGHLASFERISRTTGEDSKFVFTWKDLIGH